MTSISSFFGVAFVVALVIVAGLSLFPPCLSPFDRFSVNDKTKGIRPTLEFMLTEEVVPVIFIVPDNLESDVKEYQAQKERKERAEKKKKEEEARKKAEKEKKKKEEERAVQKKKEEEVVKRKKQEEAKRREEEEERRILQLVEDEETLELLKQRVEEYERLLEPFLKDLEAAKQLREGLATKEEEEVDDKLSKSLTEQFEKLELAEIASIVEKPLVYNDSDKTDIGHVSPYGKKVMILTVSDSSEQSTLNQSLSNRQEYCNLHGYMCKFVDLGDKIRALQQAFDSYPQVEWIWWMNSDLIIMNPYLELGEHLLSNRALTERLTYERPLRSANSSFKGGIYHSKGQIDARDIDILLTQDEFGVNEGSMFLRRSHITDLLLDSWYDLKGSAVDKEKQHALNHLLLTHSTVQQHTGLYPQRLFNSYTEGRAEELKFKDTDLALAACGSFDDCEGRYMEAYKRRKRVPQEFQVEE